MTQKQKQRQTWVPLMLHLMNYVLQTWVLQLNQLRQLRLRLAVWSVWMVTPWWMCVLGTWAPQQQQLH